MRGFRRQILKLARECDLEGLVFNDLHEFNVVRAIVNGPKDAIFTFIGVTGELMDTLGVEMKVEDARVKAGSLPQPVARVPNSIEDEEDRFDKAIGILQEMNESLKVLPEMLEILTRIDESTAQEDETQR